MMMNLQRNSSICVQTFPQLGHRKFLSLLFPLPPVVVPEDPPLPPPPLRPDDEDLSKLPPFPLLPPPRKPLGPLVESPAMVLHLVW